MQLIVQQTVKLRGCVTVPSSKSQSIRAILLASFCCGTSTIENVLDSDDTQDAIRVCQLLGATIDKQGDKLTITSRGLPLQPVADAIFTGNSGITTRFVMPFLGLRQNDQQAMTLDCDEQMRARPIRPLVEALRELGLTCHYLQQEGTCPVAVSGFLKGGKAEVGGITSQYLSALLLALPCALQDSEITVMDLHERPYIEMTLNWLREQGIHYHQQTTPASTQKKPTVSRDVFHIPGGQRYHAFHKMIGGDFSSASYLIAAAALIPGEVILEGLNMQDPQGDKRLVPILQEMGADIRVEPTQLIIRGGKPLRGVRIDGNEIPDLLPTLAVIGSQAQGKTEIYHCAQARIKETDRIHSMTQGLTRMGIRVEELADGMVVHAGRLQAAKVQGFGDHRTVMALALAGMLASGETHIDDALAMTKTFPDFVTVMQSLGAKMELSHA